MRNDAAGAAACETAAIEAHRLAAIWNYLSSWMAADGGLNGPVVHRLDLKRLFAIHDTAWTQQAAIQGLLHLYRRSGRDYWMMSAVRLGDAQCARQVADGRFLWAGHEDDRFSSLVHNALADCALLDLAGALRHRDPAREERYVRVAERNLREFVIRRLYRPGLGGFAMNPIDYYAGRDRFILNMNAIAIEALIKLDRQRDSGRHADLIREVGERILSLQSSQGLSSGGLPYSDHDPDQHISLYTALTLRGLSVLAEFAGEEVWRPVIRRGLAFLNRMRDPDTGLWYHKLQNGRIHRFPIFVAGAGMIGNSILEVEWLAGPVIDVHDLAERLLRFQYPHGGIRNFIGYDHPENGRRYGRGRECWEDVYPTPNWNAQAFHFLSQVLPPPEAPLEAPAGRAWACSWRYTYGETRVFSSVVGIRPLTRGVLAFYVKRWGRGLVVPGPHMIWRAAVKQIAKFRAGRAVMKWARDRARDARNANRKRHHARGIV